MAHSHLVQQGGELAYLIWHDPEFRRVRREHLIEAGNRVRLKAGLPPFVDFLREESKITNFLSMSFRRRRARWSYRRSKASCRRITSSARARLRSGHRANRSIKRVRAGYGKVAVLDELQAQLRITPDRVIYVGDGSSDIHVMLHVNSGDGFTIAVSDNQLAPIAKSTVLSENASSVLVPVLDQVLGLRTGEIRTLLESTGLVLDDWQRARTDRVLIREWAPLVSAG